MDMLFLTGGCAREDGVADVIQMHTGLPTVIANPFSDSGIKADEMLQRDSPLFLKVCGIAVRGAG